MASAAAMPTRHWRRLGLGLLFLAEVLFLTVSFEPSARFADDSFAAGFVGNAATLLRILIAVAATLLIVTSPRMAELRDRFAPDPRRYPGEWVALHVVLFVGLFQYTGWLFEGGLDGRTEIAILGWFSLCAVVAATGCLAFAPARAWHDFLSTEKPALLASLLAGLAVWVFGLLVQQLWRPLASATLHLVYLLLGSFYPGIEYDAAQGTIGTERLLVEIAPQCAGYEGLALVTVFVTVYLWLFRKRATFPQALWLYPAGLVAIWLANVLRIATLIVIGTEISPTIAAGGFHSQAGWIAFTAIALGLIALSHHLGVVVRAPAADPARTRQAAALLVPLMAMLATSMVTSALSHGTDVLYPLGVVVTAVALYAYRAAYREMAYGFSPVPIVIGVAVFVAWLWLVPGVPVESGIADAGPPTLPPLALALWIVFRALGSVVTVPVAEELAFRGYLLRKFVARDFENVPATRFTPFSFVVSSLLFGLLHHSFVAGVVAGALFAVATYHRGRVWDAIVAHMTANGLIAIAVLGFGRWDLWI